MKAVLISIRPKWCEKISRREKTIEVRKTRPKLEAPFKCYIYCTGGPGFLNWVNGVLEWLQEDFLGGRLGLHIRLNKKVVGEFVCDEIHTYGNVATDNWRFLSGNCHENEKEQLTQKALLSELQVHKYANGKKLYGWHISNLVIYDKPKELSEFNRYTEDSERPCEKGNPCEHEYFDYSEDCKACHIDFDGEDCPKMKLQRPPQSWCYVEVLE